MIVSPRSAHCFSVSVVRHDITVFGEHLVTDSAFAVLLGDLSVSTASASQQVIVPRDSPRGDLDPQFVGYRGAIALPSWTAPGHNRTGDRWIGQTSFLRSFTGSLLSSVNWHVLDRG